MIRRLSSLLLAVTAALLLPFPAVASTQASDAKSAAFPSYVYDGTSVEPEGVPVLQHLNSPDQRSLGDGTPPAVLSRGYDDHSNVASTERPCDQQLEWPPG